MKVVPYLFEDAGGGVDDSCVNMLSRYLECEPGTDRVEGVGQGDRSHSSSRAGQELASVRVGSKQASQKLSRCYCLLIVHIPN